jgi:3'-5' exoribonuclease
MKDKNLRNVAASVLSTSEFEEWPASLSFHHHYVGGLLLHTVEVTEYALSAAQPLGLDDLSRDILITACVWHDFMKIEDYEKVPFVSDNRRHVLIDGGPEAFIASDKYSTIRHVQGSAIEFSNVARAHGIPRSIEDRVVHCIIAHHGRPEWGSPVEPKTVEALLLHQADMLSAKFGATKNP